MFDFSEPASFLPSPSPAMEEGCCSTRSLSGHCQDHPFPSLPERTYLQPLQQCVTTAKRPVGSCASASPSMAYLTTLSAPLGSQHHQKPSSSSDAAGKRAMEEENQAVTPSIPWAGPLGGSLPSAGIFGSICPLSTFLCSSPAHSLASPGADKRRSLACILVTHGCSYFTCVSRARCLFHGKAPNQGQEEHNHTCTQKSPLATRSFNCFSPRSASLAASAAPLTP